MKPHDHSSASASPHRVPARFRQLALAAGMAATLASAALAQNVPLGAFVPTLINSSTIPANGDLNPYGVAFVPSGFPQGGLIQAGDVLVTNFNNSSNLQGLGTTIIKFTPTGPIAPPNSATAFFTSQQAGLSTALGVLPQGFVIVGNVPTTDGTYGTIQAGSLQVLDAHAHVVATWTDKQTLDGPWDLTIDDRGSIVHVFVSNVLNGTVSRLDLTVTSTTVTLNKKTTIATGYTHVPNMAALVLGPTGLAYDRFADTLYVASTNDNAIYAVTNASERTSPVVQGATVFNGSELRGPLALRFTPDGDLLAANGDAVNGDTLHPSEIVEFTRFGRFVSEYDVDASQGGAFGLDVRSDFGAPFNYAVIDDVTNNLTVYRLPTF
jgi:hypothetical protein